MELGLSLGDSSSKPFGFLASKKPPLIDHNHISSSNTPPKSSGLGFSMALGIHSSSPKTARKSAEDDNNTDQDYSSEETVREKHKELHLLPFAPLHRLPPFRQQSFPWSSDNGSSEGGSSGNVPVARGFDVNRLVAAEEVSSPNSAASSFRMDFGSYRSGGGNKRGLEMAVVAGGNDGVEGEGGSNNSRGGGASDDDENGLTRKKLRLSKEQSAFLEESFKEHNTLNPKQKLALAKQLNLRPRQVEVWFQNRRARTKLKQTEVDYEYLKRCCETLTEENRKLHKELQELRALKSSNPYYMQLPATTLTMCPSCERVATTITTTPPPSSTVAFAKPNDQATNSSKATATANPLPFPVSRPKFYPFCQTTPATSYPHKSAAS